MIENNWRKEGGVDNLARIAEFLGGAHTFRRQVSSPRDWLAVILERFPVAAIDALAARHLLERDEIHRLIVSKRSLERRRASRDRLSRDETDRAERVARVLSQALDVLGDDAKVRRWLHAPNSALAGDVPLDLLETEAGARHVETVLGRLEYGIYS
jgi:putative toxin-antitoxin system antitoxin component (TIGR02293 family)